jgi:putative flippase GtrA
MKAAIRFSKYATTGFATFLLDIAILFVFIDLFDFYYLTVSTFSFIIATTLNYFLVRRFVFNKTRRRIHTGYFLFALLSLIGLAVVTGAMVLMVEYFAWHYILARAVAVSIVFGVNYIINLHFNFQVVGEH